MELLTATPAVAQARLKWRYTGAGRPPFAEVPQPGQESVWDFPRPPRIEACGKELRVEVGGVVLARTSAGMRVLETAGAPTYYVPPDHVAIDRLRQTGHRFHCEWKGLSDELASEDVEPAGWVLAAVYPEFRALRGWYAFYPQRLACFVDDERATAQPGGYYGGWVTRDLAGPIKGGPGSAHW